MTQVSVFKLLGVTINNSLRWSEHIESITSKANKRLWFLERLKWAGVSQNNLVYYYEAIVRPVLEYASKVWHTSLTADQTKTIEAVQRRACQIIIGGTENCALLRLENLADRRDWQARKLFKQIMNRSGHCLHHLLPAKSDETVTSRLRRSVKLPHLFPRTNRFQNSFICFDFIIISNSVCRPTEWPKKLHIPICLMLNLYSLVKSKPNFIIFGLNRFPTKQCIYCPQHLLRVPTRLCSNNIVRFLCWLKMKFAYKLCWQTTK